ncbi:hypothetical protein FA95DRAFT_1488384 [Auriscalpium vulgare]|uniref:Uncharacterized protein n=1 Tax=Auriscalpium vulgare TaxID=40419 RepID=A0ACB8S197_9AGAM|nr:hypothetical protein FA95DRAFT_1488384 [Auriscalpium vulgare]
MASAATQTSPPTYDEAGTSTDTEATTSTPGFTGVFRVGRKELHGPLVEAKHLKLHLGLLGAFVQLRQQLEAGRDAGLPEPAMRLEAERRWAWFVGLAVERFELWVKSLGRAPPTDAKQFAQNAAPPLDVWLVWHSYMLNPEAFADDCSRHKFLVPLNALLTSSDRFFFEALLGDMSELTPSEARAATWLSATGTPFDPLEATQALTHQNLICSVCQKAVQALYLENNGTGYAQRNFSATCPACDFVITKEKLAVFQFTSDLSLDMSSKTVRSSGTLRTGNNVPLEQLHTSRAIKEQILSAAPFRPTGSTMSEPGTPKSALEMAEAVGWSWSRVEKAVSPKVKARTGARIMGCYHDQRPFSVELVGAVLRQGSFITKMRDLHWTEVDYFDNPEDELVLHHANVRYHAFLDLMSSLPSSFLVPTLDIDLVWHTHQLTGPCYQRDCKAYVGRYVNHDDKVEETHLANAFDLTCRAWFDRFKVHYMQCGCPLPGDTIGQKLSRIASRSYPQSALSPPPELPELLVASHPSDHNSVAVPALPHYKANHRAFEKKMQRRRDRAARDGTSSKEQFDHGGLGFAPAFLVPVPLLWGEAGACVAGAGNIVGAGAWGGFAGCSAVSQLADSLTCGQLIRMCRALVHRVLLGAREVADGLVDAEAADDAGMDS